LITKRLTQVRVTTVVDGKAEETKRRHGQRCYFFYASPTQLESPVTRAGRRRHVGRQMKRASALDTRSLQSGYGYREVVQRGEGFRLHLSGRWRGCVRPLLGDSGRRFQDPGRG